MKIIFKSNFNFPTRYKYTIRYRQYRKGQVKQARKVTKVDNEFSTIEFLGAGELRGVSNEVFEVCKDNEAG